MERGQNGSDLLGLPGLQFDCLWWSLLSGPHSNRHRDHLCVSGFSGFSQFPSNCSRSVGLQGKGQLLVLVSLH